MTGGASNIDCLPMASFPRTDLHVHATRYRKHGRRDDMTVAGVVRRCEEVSLQVVGIVEHLNSDAKHPVQCLEGLVEEFRGVSSELSLLVGAELDILDGRGVVSGSQEIKDRLGLDYFLGAVHGLVEDASSAGEFFERYHKLVMGAVEGCPFVDAIAHPWCVGRALEARGLVDEWSFERIPERYRRELAQALAECGKAVEVNAKAQAAFADPAFREFVRSCRDAGVKAMAGSDAHSMERIGDSRVVDEFLMEMAFPAEQIWTPARR